MKEKDFINEYFINYEKYSLLSEFGQYITLTQSQVIIHHIIFEGYFASLGEVEYQFTVKLFLLLQVDHEVHAQMFL